MALEDAIKRRISKGNELQQRQIATGRYSSGNQYFDPYKEERLATLLPQTPAINFDFSSILGQMPQMQSVAPIQLPSVNIVMPELKGPEEESAGEEVVEEAPSGPQYYQPGRFNGVGYNSSPANDGTFRPSSGSISGVGYNSSQGGDGTFRTNAGSTSGFNNSPQIQQPQESQQGGGQQFSPNPYPQATSSQNSNYRNSSGYLSNSSLSSQNPNQSAFRQGSGGNNSFSSGPY